MVDYAERTSFGAKRESINTKNAVLLKIQL